ncbi:hypothetical protein [Azospirillum argentinense]
MRFVYVPSAAAPAGQFVQHIAAVADSHIVHDSSVDRARYDALLAPLDDGDELLTPGLEHLGDTTRAALASLRRAMDAGIRVTLLREGMDGAVILQIAALLGALPGTEDAPRPLQGCRAYGRATPGSVARILALSADGAPIRTIAAAVGLSIATVVRVRHAHRAALSALRSADRLVECLGSAQ